MAGQPLKQRRGKRAEGSFGFQCLWSLSLSEQRDEKKDPVGEKDPTLSPRVLLLSLSLEISELELTGGIPNAQGDITQGLPRVNELFEARIPKGAALLAQTEGTVHKLPQAERSFALLSLLVPLMRRCSSQPKTHSRSCMLP